jgi:hypothetical protein
VFCAPLSAAPRMSLLSACYADTVPLPSFFIFMLFLSLCFLGTATWDGCSDTRQIYASAAPMDRIAFLCVFYVFVRNLNTCDGSSNSETLRVLHRR